MILQKDLQNLEDAENELLMAEEESTTIPYPFWTTKFHMY